MEKQLKFQKVLEAAKTALDSINIPFHLQAGTALGAHREKKFIPHDHDIDLGIFATDVPSIKTVYKILNAMTREGFTIEQKFGKLKRGYEIGFRKNGVPLDIFLIYKGNYRGKSYYINGSYYGLCDELKFSVCIFGTRPFKVQNITFFGKKYKSIPKQTLTDIYGKDWKTPKKFDYFEGLAGGYKGLLTDYYNPRPKNRAKIAFCFLLYDRVVNNDLWIKFFKQDNYPIKSYTIYSHIKEITKKTPEWIIKNKVKPIDTDWCESNLVYAWIKMLRKALKDPNNQYFTLLSGSCIPLFDFNTTYKKITASKKSRLSIDIKARVYKESGLYYASQWVILNRYGAKLLLELKDTKDGVNYRKKIYYKLKNAPSCPDEVYPINWFIHKLGKPSTPAFKKHFRNKTSTFTNWTKKDNTHPTTYTKKLIKRDKKKICDSGAIFARKFTETSAPYLMMKCK